MSRGAVAPALVMVAVILGGRVSVTDPFDRGPALYQQGKYDAAVEAFGETIAAAPSSAAAYANRGVAGVRAGDVAGAIADSTQALRLSPGDPAVYFDRGDAHALAGDHASAIADWRAAIAFERDPRTKARMERRASLGASETMPRVTATTLPGASPAPAPPSFVAAPAMPRVVAAPDASAPPAAAPPSVAPPPGAAPPASGASPSVPAPAEDLDARTLANRALSRELDGDHPGAIADLGAAIVKENDPMRRASMQHLLQLLQTPQ